MRARSGSSYLVGIVVLSLAGALVSGRQLDAVSSQSALDTPCAQADVAAAAAATGREAPSGGQAPRELLNLRARDPYLAPPTARIRYGSHALQFGDLRLPKGSGPFPLAIVIHGGYWSGTQSSAPPGYTYMASLAASLACQGVAAWDIEYRRVGNGGEWPTLFLDVGQAADFVRTLAREHPIDLTRVFAIGHSAGGHLALWLGLRDKLPATSALYVKDPLPLVGSISLAGPPDLDHFLTVEKTPGYSPSRPVAPIFTRMFGAEIGSAEYAKRIREGSPATMLPTSRPQFFIVGRLDTDVPIDQFTSYQALAASKNQSLQIRVVEGAGHFATTDPAHPQTAGYLREAVRSMLGEVKPAH